MASFLKNNGDIILDAVLTDYGRKLLARGDGSFNIVKFALGDDEIDYSLFLPNNDSSTQDLDIMNTPILEAFTNNAASMKSMLMTMSDDMMLYLPIIKLNTNFNEKGTLLNNKSNLFSGYIVPVNVGSTDTKYTSEKLKTAGGNKIAGVLTPGSMNDTDVLIVDQGLDTTDMDPQTSLMNENASLYENEYNVFVDNRFCELININDGNVVRPQSIDDDGIAVYKFMQTINSKDVSMIQPGTNGTSAQSPIAGTKGSRLKIKIHPKTNLKGSDMFFVKYGKLLTVTNIAKTNSFLTLRTTVRVVSATTGYNLEIPILFVKNNS